MTRFRNPIIFRAELEKQCREEAMTLSLLPSPCSSYTSCVRIYSRGKKQFGEAEQVTLCLINMHVVKRCILPCICGENKTAATTGTLVNICIKARCRLISLDQYF